MRYTGVALASGSPAGLRSLLGLRHVFDATDPGGAMAPGAARLLRATQGAERAGAEAAKVLIQSLTGVPHGAHSGVGSTG